ncbi:MAG: hypothetical protein ACLQSR_07065 [Limisphaerales bacterium]
MNKKNCVLIAFVLVLAVVYAIYFTDWFRTKAIIISHTARPFGRGGRELMVFSIDSPSPLTEIKVVPLAEWQTNKSVLPVWHLVGLSSDTTIHFSYGQNIDGMDPEVDGTQAQPLEPGVMYHMMVTGSSAKGFHNFEIGPAPTNQAPQVNGGP